MRSSIPCPSSRRRTCPDPVLFSPAPTGRGGVFVFPGGQSPRFFWGGALPPLPLFCFFCGWLRLGFGFYCCVGSGLIPQGFSPWNLGHFLLVQKVTKDTPRGEGFRFISAPRASLRSVALRNAPAGAAPLPWEPLSYRQRQGLRPFSLIFSRGCNGEKFPQKTIEKGQLTL